MDNSTATNTTSESSSVFNPADNIMPLSRATTSSTTTSTASKSNPAAGIPENEMADSVYGDSDDAVEYFNYKLVYERSWMDDYLPNVEDPRHYDQGGFHPVLLGDVLGDGGRFRVVHKLGQGGFATVWLCHDSVSKKWRAVKIMQARASTAECPDMRALKLFDGMDPDVLAANGVQLPLEHFWIEGPNGRHLCFVLPLLGPQLLSVAQGYGHVPELMKDVCFRLVMALKFIHSQDLCHGDFRPDNILFRLVDGVDEWEEEAMMKLLGEPYTIPVQHIKGPQVDIEPGVPRYLVEPTTIECSVGVCSSQIAVIDFGISYPVTGPSGNCNGIPTPYAAPESLFGQDDAMGFHSDIWALGVALCAVRFAIEPFANNYRKEKMDALQNMERIMGPLPEPYRSIWKGWNNAFINSVDENGAPLNDDSWKDGSVMATLETRDEELYRESRIEQRGHPHMLNFLMRSQNHMGITHKEAAHITNQAAADPGRMPEIKQILDETCPRYQSLVKYSLPEAELTQMFDLLMKIFQWQPQDRATIDQIADHEWFGGRNKQKQAAATPSCVPGPAARTTNTTNTNTTATDTDTYTDNDTDTDADPGTDAETNTGAHTKRAHPSSSPGLPAKRSKGAVEDAGLIKTAWESWTFCRGQVALRLCRSARRLARLLLWGLGEIGRTVSLVVGGGLRGVRGRGS